MPGHRPPLSVVIPCKNEQTHVEACVRSVLHWADEILIADSGSTDRTLEIAEQLCHRHPGVCRLIQREFCGFGPFKGWAVAQARHDWVLVLDADERATPALQQEIDRQLSRGDCPDAFYLGFEHRFLGLKVRYAWGQHRVIRLFRKSVAAYDDKPVHEKVVVSTGRCGHLRQRLEHWTCTSLERWYAKKNHYTSLGAEELWARGRRATLFDLLMRPPLRFIRSYIFNLGFLDGAAGFFIAVDDALTSLQKYLKLWEIQQRLRDQTGNLMRAAKTATPPPEHVSACTHL